MFVLVSMIDRADTELNATIASGLMWLLGVTFLGYAGFATAQDVAAILAVRSGRPYSPEIEPQPPAPTVIVPPAGDTNINIRDDPPNAG